MEPFKECLILDLASIESIAWYIMRLCMCDFI